MDHVHLLARFPPILPAAELIKEVKGASSHLITHQVRPGEFFKWQGAYGAFTVQKVGVRALTDYIDNQKAHHASGRLVEEWERCETQPGDQ